jgi:hypothetical protein
MGRLIDSSGHLPPESWSRERTAKSAAAKMMKFPTVSSLTASHLLLITCNKY